MMTTTASPPKRRAHSPPDAAVTALGPIVRYAQLPAAAAACSADPAHGALHAGTRTAVIAQRDGCVVWQFDRDGGFVHRLAYPSALPSAPRVALVPVDARFCAVVMASGADVALYADPLAAPCVLRVPPDAASYDAVPPDNATGDVVHVAALGPRAACIVTRTAVYVLDATSDDPALEAADVYTPRAGSLFRRSLAVLGSSLMGMPPAQPAAVAACVSGDSLYVLTTRSLERWTLDGAKLVCRQTSPTNLLQLVADDVPEGAILGVHALCVHPGGGVAVAMRVRNNDQSQFLCTHFATPWQHYAGAHSHLVCQAEDPLLALCMPTDNVYVSVFPWGVDLADRTRCVHETVMWTPNDHRLVGACSDGFGGVYLVDACAGILHWEPSGTLTKRPRTLAPPTPRERLENYVYFGRKATPALTSELLGDNVAVLDTDLHDVTPLDIQGLAEDLVHGADRPLEQRARCFAALLVLLRDTRLVDKVNEEARLHLLDQYLALVAAAAHKLDFKSFADHCADPTSLAGAAEALTSPVINEALACLHLPTSVLTKYAHPLLQLAEDAIQHRHLDAACTALDALHSLVPADRWRAAVRRLTKAGADVPAIELASSHRDVALLADLLSENPSFTLLPLSAMGKESMSAEAVAVEQYARHHGDAFVLAYLNALAVRGEFARALDLGRRYPEIFDEWLPTVEHPHLAAMWHMQRGDLARACRELAGVAPRMVHPEARRTALSMLVVASAALKDIATEDTARAYLDLLDLQSASTAAPDWMPRVRVWPACWLVDAIDDHELPRLWHVLTQSIPMPEWERDLVARKLVRRALLAGRLAELSPRPAVSLAGIEDLDIAPLHDVYYTAPGERALDLKRHQRETELVRRALAADPHARSFLAGGQADTGDGHADDDESM